MAGNGQNFAGGAEIHRPFNHFFKVIMAEAIDEKRLMLPEKFARTFRNELTNEARLEVPNGRVWTVGLSREAGARNKVWLDAGFGDFLNFHSIAHPGHLLMFEYNGLCNFKVYICDLSGCEIVYPNSAPLPSPEAAAAAAEEEEEAEESDDSEFDINEVNEDSESDSDEEFCPVLGRRENGRSGDASGSRRQPHRATKRAAPTASAGQENRGKRPCLVVDDSQDTADSQSEDDDWDREVEVVGKGKKVATGNGASGSRRRQNLPNGIHFRAPENTHPADLVSDQELWMRVMASGIVRLTSLAGDFRELSRRSKNALRRAIECHNPSNPSALLVLKQANLFGPMLFPKAFANRHFPANSEAIMVHLYEEKKRCVGTKLMSVRNSRGLTSLMGWGKNFNRESFMDVGDVCLFELVHSESRVLELCVFRAY